MGNPNPDMPADIAAAIDALQARAWTSGRHDDDGARADAARAALDAAILARLAAVEAELDNLRRIHRWNVEHHGGEVLVCRNNHDKGDDCEWERFVPEERLTAALARAERLEKDIADTEATRDHFREKLAEMYDHHAAALARAERLETALRLIIDGRCGYCKRPNRNGIVPLDDCDKPDCDERCFYETVDAEETAREALAGEGEG